MISYKHQLIFVHIPKTGGSSIEDIIWSSKKDRVEQNLWMGAIRPYYNKYQTGGLQHLFASQIFQEVGPRIFDVFFKFSIVRNPWDKVVSQYLYMSKRKDLRDFIGMNEGDSLKTYLLLIQKKTHVQWEHQYKFIFDKNGNPLVDYIGRFENFNDEVKTILAKVNLDKRVWGLVKPRIPHANKSEREEYHHYFDPESCEMVQEMYKQDIELLGYQF